MIPSLLINCYQIIEFLRKSRVHLWNYDPTNSHKGQPSSSQCSQMVKYFDPILVEFVAGWGKIKFIFENLELWKQI